MRRTFLVIACITALTNTTLVKAKELHPSGLPDFTPDRAAALTKMFTDFVATKGINTAGVVVIKGGKVAWTGTFGSQAPGVPASENTQFNAASLTKTVTTETILRLVDQGKLDLDESMAPYWVDPDLADDPRHKDLTPRMALSHTTGFLNWRFLAKDYKLHFQNDPGAKYGYSGEGMKYVAAYAERKLGRGFESLVKEHLFTPLKINGASISVREANFPNIARRLDEDGAFWGPYCFPQKRWCSQEGDYSAAGNLVITVNDFAKFMISVMKEEGYSAKIAADRNHVQADKGDETKVICGIVPDGHCPKTQGYGLGWEVFDYGDTQLLSHGGSDWAELTTAYFYTGTQDGLVIFLNAPNYRALQVMPELIELIDPISPLVAHYKNLRLRSNSRQ
ncbi:serine hydrolase domain-containing protein [Paremcibacter congregatus]|nr:serine hydrolase domain-containing protein [Paremcibacter congregatus]